MSIIEFHKARSETNHSQIKGKYIRCRIKCKITAKFTFFHFPKNPDIIFVEKMVESLK